MGLGSDTDVPSRHKDTSHYGAIIRRMVSAPGGRVRARRALYLTPRLVKSPGKPGGDCTYDTDSV
jgi:hypothetical protein